MKFDFSYVVSFSLKKDFKSAYFIKLIVNIVSTTEHIKSLWFAYLGFYLRFFLVFYRVVAKD